jgi:hypothetical protein
MKYNHCQFNHPPEESPADLYSTKKPSVEDLSALHLNLSGRERKVCSKAASTYHIWTKIKVHWDTLSYISTRYYVEFRGVCIVGPGIFGSHFESLAWLTRG